MPRVFPNVHQHEQICFVANEMALGNRIDPIGQDFTQRVRIFVTEQSFFFRSIASCLKPTKALCCKPEWRCVAEYLLGNAGSFLSFRRTSNESCDQSACACKQREPSETTSSRKQRSVFGEFLRQYRRG